MRLSTAVRELPGVGSRRGAALKRLGIEDVSDLLKHLPMRYEHEWAEGTIRDLPMNGIGTARGTVVRTRWVARGGPGGAFRGQGRFEATLQDHSDRLALVWFNAKYLRDRLHPGTVIRVQGKVKAFGGYAQMVNPHWEALADSGAAPAGRERLRPVYPASEDLPSAVIEALVAHTLPQVLAQVVDPLPEGFVRARNMPALAEAFGLAHQPQREDQAAAARRRLAYNELLLLQLGIALKRQFNATVLRAPALRWSSAIDEHIRARFPFALTGEQDRVIREIVADLKQTRPMNRLLQGDVGSGKTVVALYALLLAAAHRRQGAIMAPTELLAEQHYLSISAMLAGSNVRLALLTGGRGAAGSAQRTELERGIEDGSIDIVIGTQAILTVSVRFNDLAVVVVDEQHRFGVLQRAAFRTKAGGEEAEETGDERAGATGASGVRPDPHPSPLPQKGEGVRHSPHYLVMTATPIPRTLSLTVFGDLDISTLKGLPPGRTPITTRVVGQDKADEVYRYLVQRLSRGEQAYVVVPTIDASGHETAGQLKNVTAHAKLLQDTFCGDFRVATMHGRMKQETREAIMQRFRAGAIHVLVATTVIEVGVDVPNASLLVVEHAERFGLAQLHQLRGRIGRGTSGRRSLCVFIAEPTTDEARRRLEAIAGTTDGFKIAEEDLAIRGMGEFFGTRQHGLPPMRVARIPEDLDLLQLAKRDANEMVAGDPLLTDPSRARLRKVLIQQYGDALGLIDVG